MWVEGGDIHDELLDQLGGVLAPPADLPLAPSSAELEALVAAVAARWPDGAVAPASRPVAEGRPRPGAPIVPLRPAAGRRQMRRLGSSAWRAGSVAAALVVFSASAAAAAGGVPLPGPVRAVAYTVGLPVDSPALNDTNHHIDELKAAVKANDKPKAVATARRLSTDLKKVPSDEKKEAEQKMAAVIPEITPLIENAEPPVQLPPLPASSTTTVTSPAASTTDTTAAPHKENDKAPAPDTTTTERPTTTTTAQEPTTTTTAPPAGQTASDGNGAPSGDPGTSSGSGDPSAGGAGTGTGTGTGSGDQGSTTATTAPPTTTTTTTAPAAGDPSGAGDPGSTTTTTTTTSSTTTTTTTMPPSDPGAAPTP